MQRLDALLEPLLVNRLDAQEHVLQPDLLPEPEDLLVPQEHIPARFQACGSAVPGTSSPRNTCLHLNKLTLDCTSLADLADAAQEEGYRTNVGFVTFDDEKPTRRKIAHLHSSPILKAYGLDNLGLLRNDPFW